MHGEFGSSVEDRAAILRGFGANATVCAELLHYNEPRFTVQAGHLTQPVPLLDEAFVDTWKSYSDCAADVDVAAVLATKLPQFAFPIEPGISQTADYRKATRKGQDVSGMSSATGLVLHEPAALKLLIHPTAGGHVPVLVPGAREDFEILVQALSARNEPVAVPASMGACTVTGFNNWDRVAQYRETWLESNPASNWSRHFQEFAKRSELYQDRFLIISQGAYSNVGSKQLGLDEVSWFDKSYYLRLEHECTHYFMLRLFGSMANNLFDEIIADFAGICAANDGCYNAAWFLRFMGLESYPDYRVGGRLQNYCQEASLSTDTFLLLQRLVVEAAANIAEFQGRVSGLGSKVDVATCVMTLCTLSLEQMAAPGAVELLADRLQQVVDLQNA